MGEGDVAVDICQFGCLASEPPFYWGEPQLGGELDLVPLGVEWRWRPGNRHVAMSPGLSQSEACAWTWRFQRGV